MASATPNTILLKHIGVTAIQSEGTAGGTITPGMLVGMNSAGAIVAHGTAGGSAPSKSFALEDDLQGRGINDNYDATTYKNVRYVDCSPGTEIYAILADGMSIAIGDLLESNGDGTLREHTAQAPGAGATSPAVGIITGQAIARALEAVVTATSPVATARIKVRVV